VASIRHNFESYGPKLPAELWQELESLEQRLQAMA